MYIRYMIAILFGVIMGEFFADSIAKKIFGETTKWNVLLTDIVFSVTMGFCWLAFF